MPNVALNDNKHITFQTTTSTLWQHKSHYWTGYIQVQHFSTVPGKLVKTKQTRKADNNIFQLPVCSTDNNIYLLTFLVMTDSGQLFIKARNTEFRENRQFEIIV